MSPDVPEGRTEDNPWRYRCPENHASVTIRTNTFWCSACCQSYSKDELQDLAADDDALA